MAAVKARIEVSPVLSPTAGSGVKCPDCEKVFTRSSSLVAHRRLHTGERPYMCDVCDRAFSDKSNLRSHVKIHTVKEKLFTCEICTKTFAMKRYLHKHRQTHSDWNPCISTSISRPTNSEGTVKITPVVRSPWTTQKEIIVLPPKIKQEPNTAVSKASAPVISLKVPTPKKSPNQPIFVHSKSPKPNPLTVAYSCKIIKQQLPDGTIAHFMDDGRKLTPVTLVSVDNNTQQSVFKPISISLPDTAVAKHNLAFDLNNSTKRLACNVAADESVTAVKLFKRVHNLVGEQSASCDLTDIRVNNPGLQPIDSQTATDKPTTTDSTILSKEKKRIEKNIPMPVSLLDGSHTTLLNSTSQNLSFASIFSANSQIPSEILISQSGNVPNSPGTVPTLSELALARITPVAQNFQLQTNHGALSGITIPIPAGGSHALMKMLPAKHFEPTMTSIQTEGVDTLHDEVTVKSEQTDDSPASVIDSDEEGQLIIKQDIVTDDGDEGEGMSMLNSDSEHNSMPQQSLEFVIPGPASTVVEHALETVIFPAAMESHFHPGTSAMSSQDIKVTEIQFGTIGEAGDASINVKPHELIHCDEALLAKLLAGNINPADIVIVYPETTG